MNKFYLVSTAILLSLTVIVAGLAHWTINRVYVEEGYSLQLRYKGPLIYGDRQTAQTGHWANEGEIGVLQKLRGPGRHFYCPIWWERSIVPDVTILPQEVGIVTCKLGDDLPAGLFLVEGDIGNTEHKGILRKVLHPGRYRVNPYGYEVEVVNLKAKDSQPDSKRSGWVTIPTGYVGVVTNLAANPNRGLKSGVQSDVLPPGIYLVNGREQQVDIVEIGYRHTTIQATKQRDESGRLKIDQSGEPLLASDQQGIEFPSSDGFEMNMDFTAIWGLLPDQAAHAIRTIGNVDSVEDKIVTPQIESICRNSGSKYKAVELLVGEDREQFQEANVAEFQKVLSDKNITLLYGLVRHIYIPIEVRKPIQSAFIADELKLTRQEQQETAKAEAALREAEKKVELERQTVEVNTEKLYRTKLAEGDRIAKGIDAETQRLVAAIRKQTALLEAEAVEILGKAENLGVQKIEEAKAGRFKLAVEAFGTPQAYNQWVFADGLPEDLKLDLLYAGQGTLWTDMKNLGVRANLSLDQENTQNKEMGVLTEK